MSSTEGPPFLQDADLWVRTALAGAIWPQARAQVLQVARENGTQSGRLTVLHVLPDRVYRGEDEVLEAFRRGMEKGERWRGPALSTARVSET